GLGDSDEPESLGLADDPPVPARLASAAIDRAADRLIALAPRIGEEDDRRLESLRAVDGHQAHYAAAARACAHFLDVALGPGPVELRHDRGEIEAVGREGARGGDRLEQVAGPAVAELAGAGVRGPAEALAESGDGGAGRQGRRELLALAQP